MVIKTSEAFYASGIPFTLGVVPIDDNMDFPAMARFYQVLRYVQSRNGIDRCPSSQSRLP